MTRFPKEMTENGIHSTLHGDYFFPECGKRIWKSIIPAYTLV